MGCSSSGLEAVRGRHRRRRRPAALAPVGAAAACLLAFAPAPAHGALYWPSHKVMNIAHQGGENEAPSGTMYALERSMRIGSDMLEIDIHVSRDGHLMVLHDATVDRTTNGSGLVSEMTRREIQSLDAAHWFVPGRNMVRGQPRSSYPFRGVRTGKRPPPRGFKRSDFRIPTLHEVMRAYPDVPINIEIKGTADTDFDSFRRNALVLADYLNRLGRTRGINIASFNDLAIAQFRERAPQFDLSPGIAGVAAFKAANIHPGPGMKVLQVPINFEGIPVTDSDFVRRAHAHGLAVHVWTVNDEPTFAHLLDLDVEGIMTAESERLERFLCSRKVVRPHRPRAWPGRHCNFRRASIACDVRPIGPVRLDARGRPIVRLRRHDEFRGRCSGRVLTRVGSRAELRRAGVRPVRARAGGRFNFRVRPPRDGGPRTISVRLDRPPAHRRLGRTGVRRAEVKARVYDAFSRRARLRVRG